MLANEKYIGIHRHNEEAFINIYPAIVSEDVFNIVQKRIQSNKHGKHVKEVVYLLKGKVVCGYCGHAVVAESGTSKSDDVMRYYKCGGKKNRRVTCESAPIRKELLEQIVIDTTHEMFLMPGIITRIADMVLEAYQKKDDTPAFLDILQNEYAGIQRSIDNLLDNMERGIVTQSMRECLQQLELRRTDINEKILYEKSKQRKPLTQKDIIDFISVALKKKIKGMLFTLVKKVKLFKDKVQIYYNYKEKDKTLNDEETPDGESHQELLLYTAEKTYDMERRKAGKMSKKITVQVEGLIEICKNQ